MQMQKEPTWSSESAVNDKILSIDDRLKCYESLILRIQKVAPNAAIVALSLNYMEGHAVVIEHYNVPHIYLGEMSRQVPAIRDGGIHVNDIGSYLVCQAVKVLLQRAEYIYNNYDVLPKNNDHAMTATSTIERLYEPAEDFDWVFSFGNGGKGWAHGDIQSLLWTCTSNLLDTRTIPYNNRTGLIHVDHTGNCSESILSTMQNDDKNLEIPCDGCADTTNNDVNDIGGGWIWCRSPWPAVCKPQGVHRHHCSSRTTSGIFVQTFEVDNRATDEWPADRSRRVTIFLRLLKGYDADFGKAVVIVWFREENDQQTVTNLIDTKWEPRATVLDDVEIAPSFLIPSPREHEDLTLMLAVVPLSLNGSGQNETRCRLYFHSVLGEFTSSVTE